jgi:hypothetical protein
VDLLSDDTSQIDDSFDYKGLDNHPNDEQQTRTSDGMIQQGISACLNIPRTSLSLSTAYEASSSPCLAQSERKQEGLSICYMKRHLRNNLSCVHGFRPFDEFTQLQRTDCGWIICTALNRGMAHCTLSFAMVESARLPREPIPDL